MAWEHKRTGFTIVELIVVIAVIGILAGIMLVSYAASENRARDASRQSSMKEIRAALEAYRAENGTYPNEAGASWEQSNTDPVNFLDDLKPYMGVVPVDPVNDASNYFYYYRYEAGTSGWGVTCPASRGAYYVLGVTGLDNVQGTAISPGWNCENGSTVPTNGNWTTSSTRAAWGAFSLAF
jgi:type II secretion system protein G